MKAARGLHSAGRVMEAVLEAPMLKGLVKEGNTQYRAGLRIGDRKVDIENLCTCRDSRARGLICAHSLAVGLEVLNPTVAKSEPIAIPVRPSAAPEPAGVLTARKGAFTFSSETIAGSEAGELLELHLILPPNLPDAWTRGTVSFAVEGTVKGNRRSLGTLPPGRYRLAAGDFAALTALLRIASGEVPALLQVALAQAEQVLGVFVGQSRVTLGRGATVPIQPFAGRLALRVAEQPGGGLRLSVSIPDGMKLLPGQTTVWLWDGRSLHRVADDMPAAYLELFRRPVVEIPSAGVPGFLQKELPALRRWFDAPEIGAPPVESTVSLVATANAPRFHLKLEGSLNYLGAELAAHTDRRQITITSPGYRPANAAEQGALGRLRQSGFEGPTPRGEWALRGEQAILAFFAQDLPDLQRDWEVTIGQRFEHVTKDLERVQPRFEVQGSGQNWFEVGFELATESGERLSAQEIRRLLASGRRTVKLKNQKTAVLDTGLLDEFDELLKDTNPGQSRPGSYRFDPRDAGFLQRFADQQNGQILGGPTGQDWHSELPFARKVTPLNLGTEWSLLRSYQKEGVQWLNYLSKNGLAGILADEMGLGKTVQTLAFLNSIRGPKLVVCPASLTLNWQREAERFAPSLRPALLSDENPAQVATRIKEDRLWITSYGLLRRDQEALRAQNFAAIALDEAQQIKNPESQTAQAAHRLRSETKLALTGTPIENGVRDIWSVMQFLMPGFLGSRELFRERFEIPIRDQPGGAQHQRLVARLKPFILRRTKKAVATELPEKIEQISYCELAKPQADSYRKLMTAARQLLQKDGPEGQAPRRKMDVFTALLRLRQTCCDPRLLDGAAAVAESLESASQETDSTSVSAAQSAAELARRAGESAKLELLRELVSEIIEDGHRTLIFSQFSSMLKLIGAALKEDGVEYCYLDGSTRNRQAEVDRFQKGQIPVFLISLKAGGVGLNLTAADTVIHYDPWWNPAVEAQATDRVHRIGQTRSVNIYKLIARGTVEEKILSLQAKKREIADLLVENEQPLMEGLSFAEVCSLIE